jgi:hypothetical protein
MDADHLGAHLAPIWALDIYVYMHCERSDLVFMHLFGLVILFVWFILNMRLISKYSFFLH